MLPSSTDSPKTSPSGAEYASKMTLKMEPSQEVFDEEEEDEEEEEEENEELEENYNPEKKKEISEEKPPVPIFICHEATFNPQGVSRKAKVLQASLAAKAKNEDGETSTESHDEFYPRSTEKNTYSMINPKDSEYRPAALTKYPIIISQITNLVHKQLVRYKCQPFPQERFRGWKRSSRNSTNNLKTDRQRESLERKLHRLKIYQRAFSSLVIYFRPYSPIFFYTKKSYDDVLEFRLMQFKEAQNEKLKLYHEKVTIENKILNYRFPEFNLFKKSEQYLGLLFTRIKKQDEAVKFITTILSKMERALSDHFEKYRDMEDQIKLLDNEIAERMTRGMTVRMRAAPEEEDEEDGGGDTLDLKIDDDADEEIKIDENEEINEDKRMVLILAYSVCMKDLEESNKVLKTFESKYADVSPRADLENMKLAIIEEESQVDVLANTLESLEQDLIAISDAEMKAENELQELTAMPNKQRIPIIKKKMEEMEILLGEEEEDEEMEDEEEEEEEEETEEEEELEF